jgi:pilus assembly protein CpaF
MEPRTNGYGLRETDIPLLSSLQRSLLQKQVVIPDWRDTAEVTQRRFRDQVRQLLMTAVNPVDLEDTTLRLSDALSGVGLLQPFLREGDVEEVYVRGAEVAVERRGAIERLGDLAPEEYWENLIRRVAEQSGERITPRHPAVLVDLPGGQRFTGMLPPLMDAPAINIRLFGRKTLDNLRELGTFDSHKAAISGGLDDIRDPELRARVEQIPEEECSLERFLAWMMASQAGNILVAGEFSSGKTTLLNYLSRFLPQNAPVAVLETFGELQLAENLFMMRAIAPSENLPGEEPVATMDWVLNVIYTRANPSAIILGEIVSRGEAMQFLKAANLGRRAYSTIHGANVETALGRLEQLALGDQPELGLTAVRHMVAAGVDIVVHMGRVHQQGRMRRFVGEVTRVGGLHSSGYYALERLYSGWVEMPEDPVREAWCCFTSKIACKCRNTG